MGDPPGDLVQLLDHREPVAGRDHRSERGILVVGAIARWG
jgi:hypothetical protein